MQTAVIRKWGNSLALRLPQHVASDLQLSDGSTVSLAVENNALVIKPARKKYDLADLLANHTKNVNHPEADWGNPVGDEVW